MKKAVQQIMLGTVTKNEKQTESQCCGTSLFEYVDTESGVVRHGIG